MGISRGVFITPILTSNPEPPGQGPSKCRGEMKGQGRARKGRGQIWAGDQRLNSWVGIFRGRGWLQPPPGSHALHPHQEGSCQEPPVSPTSLITS